jgi:hypothetical protein
MARPDSKTQLEALHQRQIELGRKIKEAEAEARRKEREKDERRKLLAGAVALAEIAVHPDSPFAITLVDLLNHGLTKAPDRSLFDLQPLPKETTTRVEISSPSSSWPMTTRERCTVNFGPSSSSFSFITVKVAENAPTVRSLRMEASTAPIKPEKPRNRFSSASPT